MNDITFTMHLKLLSFWDTFQLDIFLGHDLFWYSYSRSTIRQTHTLRMFWIIFDQFPGATPKNCGNQLIKPSMLDIDMYYSELHIIWTLQNAFKYMCTPTCNYHWFWNYPLYRWSTTPVVVNAFYSSTKNQISLYFNFSYFFNFSPKELNGDFLIFINVCLQCFRLEFCSHLFIARDTLGIRLK